MMMRVAVLFFLASTLGYAGTWSGLLVQSNCYTREQENTNKYASTADRDMGMEARLCAPTPDTKSFAIVLPDWSSIQLNSAGDAQAAQLVHTAGKRALFQVTVDGTWNGDRIDVKSLSGTRLAAPRF